MRKLSTRGMSSGNEMASLSSHTTWKVGENFVQRNSLPPKLVSPYLTLVCRGSRGLQIHPNYYPLVTQHRLWLAAWLYDVSRNPTSDMTSKTDRQAQTIRGQSHSHQKYEQARVPIPLSMSSTHTGVMGSFSP